MRRSMIVVGMLVVLLCMGALPVFASDSDLLGSGSTAPEGGGTAAAPVDVAAGTTSVATPGEDVLAATGLDSGAALALGLGLMVAGGGAVLSTRRRQAR